MSKNLAPFLIVVSLMAQDRLTFEVASVKPNPAGPEVGFTRGFAPNGGFTARNLSVWNLISSAYGLRDLQISGGPAWIKTQGFDIQAQPASPVPRTQSLSMLQALLEDRFRLTFHRETRVQPAYALIVSDRGPRLPQPGEGRGRNLLGDFDMPSMTLETLCQVFEIELERTVVNQTGLHGPYAIKLEWASDKTPVQDSSIASLFTAVQEQLGLKLVTARAPVELFIIDGIEQPTEN